MLTWRALPLTEVVRLAAKAGMGYLIVDGVNIPTERVAAAYSRKQNWFSGQHHRHGAAVQAVAARTVNCCGSPASRRQGRGHHRRPPARHR